MSCESEIEAFIFHSSVAVAIGTPAQSIWADGHHVLGGFVFAIASLWLLAALLSLVVKE